MAGKSLPAYREIVHSTDPAIRRVHALVRRIFHLEQADRHSRAARLLREQEAVLWADYPPAICRSPSTWGVRGVASGTYLGNINMGVVGYLAGQRQGPRARGRFEARARLGTSFERDALKDRRGSRRGRHSARFRWDNPWLRAWFGTTGARLDFRPPTQASPGDKPARRAVYEGIARSVRRLASAGPGPSRYDLRADDDRAAPADANSVHAQGPRGTRLRRRDLEG